MRTIPVENFSGDPFNLTRFIQAQEAVYSQVLNELRKGSKRTHWMWFIIPQVAGLGFSTTSQWYGIKDLVEANAYWEHPILGMRLKECCEVLLSIEEKSAHAILGTPDDMKLKSCATLFSLVTPGGSVFQHLLEKYFQSKQDEKTLGLLNLTGPF